MFIMSKSGTQYFSDHNYVYTHINLSMRALTHTHTHTYVYTHRDEVFMNWSEFYEIITSSEDNYRLLREKLAPFDTQHALGECVCMCEHIYIYIYI